MYAIFTIEVEEMMEYLVLDNVVTLGLSIVN